MYIFANHCTTFILDTLINISNIPKGSENTNVRKNIPSVANIPLASLPTTSAKLLTKLPDALSSVTSFTLLSALKHMLSSSPQSFAILSNVPSASIS